MVKKCWPGYPAAPAPLEDCEMVGEYQFVRKEDLCPSCCWGRLEIVGRRRKCSRRPACGYEEKLKDEVLDHPKTVRHYGTRTGG